METAAVWAHRPRVVIGVDPPAQQMALLIVCLHPNVHTVSRSAIRTAHARSKLVWGRHVDHRYCITQQAEIASKPAISTLMPVLCCINTHSMHRYDCSFAT